MNKEVIPTTSIEDLSFEEALGKLHRLQQELREAKREPSVLRAKMISALQVEYDDFMSIKGQEPETVLDRD